MPGGVKMFPVTPVPLKDPVPPACVTGSVMLFIVTSTSAGFKVIGPLLLQTFGYTVGQLSVGCGRTFIQTVSVSQHAGYNGSQQTTM